MTQQTDSQILAARLIAAALEKLSHSEAIRDLANSVERVAFGGSAGPTGFEALSIALAGENYAYPIGTQINDLATSARDIGAGLSEIARALTDLNNTLREQSS